MLREERSKSLESLQKAQERAAHFADCCCKASYAFKVGEKVWLSSKNLSTTRPSKKLGARYLGSFEIIADYGSAFKLQLPEKMRIHNVFHVELLERYHPNTLPSCTLEEPPEPEVVDGEHYFSIERILNDKLEGGKQKYLVRWEGYGPSHDTWEPDDDIAADSALVLEYQK